MNNNNTRKLVYAAVIAAIYAVFTMALGALSYKPVILGIELRFSEVLCILPFFFPPAVWGLTIGCAIANIVSTVGFIDVIFGSAATLLAGLCSAAIGKRAKE
ncbi:MAG: QueT transporter family protein, partial [Clostridia bacterium]|nr:QueT transporter family protein [Clostridia bacterium]